MTFLMGPALLFCPADRPERYRKAAQRSDAVILDLEDAVAPADKKRARGAILAQLGSTGVVPELEPSRTIVRVNPAGSEEFEKDLHCLKHTPYRTVMLAKAEDPAQLSRLDGYKVIALCETAAGVLNATAIAAAPNVVALMWGAEDLLASLGGTSSRNASGGYRDVALHARSTVLLAARANGKEAVDSVYLDIPDLTGLALEAGDAAASGFGSKACIHPTQVAVVRAAFAPSEAEVSAAIELLHAARAAGSAVFRYQGMMVDGPVLRHAEATLRRAAGGGPTAGA